MKIQILVQKHSIKQNTLKDKNGGLCTQKEKNPFPVVEIAAHVLQNGRALAVHRRVVDRLVLAEVGHDVFAQDAVVMAVFFFDSVHFWAVLEGALFEEAAAVCFVHVDHAIRDVIEAVGALGRVFFDLLRLCLFIAKFLGDGKFKLSWIFFLF